MEVLIEMIKDIDWFSGELHFVLAFREYLAVPITIMIISLFQFSFKMSVLLLVHLTQFNVWWGNQWKQNRQTLSLGLGED